MKLLILGATGGVGRLLVSQAQAAGHAITVLTRPGAWTAPEGVRAVRGELLDGPGLAEATAGQDAVLSSIGHQRRNPANPWSSSLSPKDLTSLAAHRIIAAMKAAQVRRVVAVSAAGVGDSAPQLNLVMRFFLATTMIGDAYRDLSVMEQAYADSGLDWLCPRPTRLVHGARTGQLRVTTAFGTMDAVSRADVAGWMLDALALPAWPDAAWGGRTPQVTRA